MSSMNAVKSADRALELLELFEYRPDGLTLSDVCHITGWPKSSALALLRTLEQRRFVESSATSSKYRMGPRVASLGSSYLENMNIVQEGTEVVRRVSRTFDETVHLAILSGSDVLYIAKEEGGGQMRMVSSIGRTVPAHATGVGKVLLAFMPAEDRDRLYPPNTILPALTPKTITSYERFIETLERVRQHGYATDDGESTIGVKCIAAPIRDVSSNVVAAMSVSVPEPRFTSVRIPELFAALVDGARQLSLRMGCPKKHLTHSSLSEESVVSNVDN